MLEVQEHLKMKQTLFETREKWDQCMAEWYSAPLFSLDIAHIKKEVAGFIKTVDNLEKSKKKKYNLLHEKLVGGIFKTLLSPLLEVAYY